MLQLKWHIVEKIFSFSHNHITFLKICQFIIVFGEYLNIQIKKIKEKQKSFSQIDPTWLSEFRKTSDCRLIAMDSTRQSLGYVSINIGLPQNKI